MVLSLHLSWRTLETSELPTTTLCSVTHVLLLKAPYSTGPHDQQMSRSAY